MDGWLPTRYLAAWIDVNDTITCEDTVGKAFAAPDKERAQKICSSLSFEDLN
jgi:hypothetical protein